MKIAAFPKCYIDRIAGDRTMSVFDWIEMARSLDADGLVRLLGEVEAGRVTVHFVESAEPSPLAHGILTGKPFTFLDGAPLEVLDPAEWRRAVAWLPQRPTLFHGSVRDNVRLGRQEASEEEICRSMARARVEELSLDTPVGEAGQGLSTGQAQRVALARLFLRAPLLVLLDEPTAHLDAENAALVSEGVLELSAGRTTLLVTHRAESAAGMDRIIEISHGRAGPVT